MMRNLLWRQFHQLRFAGHGLAVWRRHKALRTASSALQMFAGRQKLGETSRLKASKISSIRKHNVVSYAASVI
jgi:serine/threonine protein kinase HipA of HipAB toxin-antitoxin module